MPSFADHPSVRAVRTMLDRAALGVAETVSGETVAFAVRDAAGAPAMTVRIERAADGRLCCTVAEPADSGGPPGELSWWYRDSRTAELEAHDVRAIRGAYDHIGRAVARLATPRPISVPPEERLRAAIEAGGHAPADVAMAILAVVGPDKAADIAEAIETAAPSPRRPGP